MKKYTIQNGVVSVPPKYRDAVSEWLNKRDEVQIARVTMPGTVILWYSDLAEQSDKEKMEKELGEYILSITTE
jgi:hypothetical protein